jgi:hypothetical protein
MSEQISTNHDLPYPRSSTMALLSLISGILAWIGVFGLGGILAVIFGHMAKKEIRQGRGMITGDGQATAGLVLGYINIAAALIGLCLFALFFLGIFSVPLCMIPFMNGINTNFSTTP